MFVIVAYDIVDKKKLVKVFKVCKQYLFRLQDSVFIGELNKEKLKEMEKKLMPLLNIEIDSCVVFITQNKNNVVTKYLTNDHLYEVLIV